MLIIRRKNLVIGLLVVLLVITGYLNFLYNNNSMPADTPADGLENAKDNDISEDTGSDKIESHVTVSDLTGSGNMEQDEDDTSAAAEASSSSFFMDYRFERELTRKKEMDYINAVIENPKSSQEMIAEAQAQLLEITSSMEKELAIEALLKSKGFKDAIAIIYKNNVNVIVDKPELEAEEVARILEIVSRQSGEKTENIKIIPKL